MPPPAAAAFSTIAATASSITPLLLTSSLRLAQLKQVAISLGVKSSGSKSVIADGICQVLADESRFPRLEKTRIMSIDMGIRNLAVCVMEVRQGEDKAACSDSGSVSGGDCGDSSRGWISSPSSRLIPNILSWQRITISPSAFFAKSSPTLSSPADEESSTSLAITAAESPAAAEKESFSPSSLSILAYALCKHLLSTHRPHQVLIERQRYRSTGGSAVQEWTLRVNSFESMIWGCLRTMAQEGIWLPVKPGFEEAPGNSTSSSKAWDPVESISPQKVVGFWESWHDIVIPTVPDGYVTTPRLSEAPAGARTQNKAYYDSKVSKTTLVTDFLYSPPIAPPTETLEEPLTTPSPTLFNLATPEALSAATLFVPSYPSPKAKSTKKKTKVEELPHPTPNEEQETGVAKDIEGGKISALEQDSPSPSSARRKKPPKGKLDDLADCLLQGLAWVKWEESRRRIVGGALGLGVVNITPRGKGANKDIVLGVEGEEGAEADGAKKKKKKKERKKKLAEVVDEAGMEPPPLKKTKKRKKHELESEPSPESKVELESEGQHVPQGQNEPEIKNMEITTDATDLPGKTKRKRNSKKNTAPPRISQVSPSSIITEAAQAQEYEENRSGNHAVVDESSVPVEAETDTNMPTSISESG